MSPQSRKQSRPKVSRVVLDQVPFFAALEASRKEKLSLDCTCNLFKRDEIIFEAGSTPISGMFLLQGLVMLTTSGAHERPLAVEVIAPGEPFGVLALANGMNYPLAARALEPSLVLEVKGSSLRELIDQEREMKDALLKMAARRFCEAQHVIHHLASSSARSRIAHAISLLIRRHGPIGGTPFLLAATRKQLACIAGTTIETCIRVIKEFEHGGLLHVLKPRCIEILNPAEIASIAHEPLNAPLTAA